jgi:hypothetical protein
MPPAGAGWLENRAVAAFFTDAGLLPRNAPERARPCCRMLAQAQLIEKIYPDSEVGSPVHTVAADARRHVP